MQLVIDIPKEMYINALNDYLCGSETLVNAIKNGTPLPKGHGRLIILSEDTVKRQQTSFSFSCQKWVSEVGLSNATLAIIEADKESDGKRMSNLEKSKEIVKANYKNADGGIFDSRNFVGDPMETIYEDEGLIIDICYYYSYFEVFGLSDTEFEELERYYNSLIESEEE